MDVIEILQSPLMRDGRSGPFLRLVLAEAVRYGMPPQAIATLDDVAAMLGFYDPLPTGAAAQIAGPMAIWRTHPDQPILERVGDVERLAYKQRCLIAFGGAAPDHMVGTAEIVCAMGNLHRKSGVPREYRDIFEWATVDVLTILTGHTREAINKERKYPTAISDDDVLMPGGRLHGTYQEIVTNLRRTAIAALEPEDNPREYLRPLAQHFLKVHTRHLAEADAEEYTEMANAIRKTIAMIERMFPDLTPQQRVQAEGAGAA